jgi:hypothetical protein
MTWMANDVEVFEDFASNGLPATGIGTLLRFEAGDGSVVQPFRRDRGDQRRCVPRGSADRALDQGHRSWRRRDEAEAQAGRHALRECRYVDRELRRESGDRGGASSGKNAYVASSMMRSPFSRAISTNRRRDSTYVSIPAGYAGLASYRWRVPDALHIAEPARLDRVHQR